jgi:glycosyltransferase involved in cell wall biosynthesis
MEIKDLITIVIPCKNEKEIIFKTLDLLNHQKNILGVKVIVCDSSDDNYTKKRLDIRCNKEGDFFNLYLCKGGIPSVARNNGYKHVKTPYVLFMDADVFLLDSNIIEHSLNITINKNLDLTTIKFRSDNGEYNYVYKSFDLFQKISTLVSPFCLGGFMLVKSEKFKELKGFDAEAKIAEDYLFSKQIKRKKFKVINKIAYTTPRRFKNKGIIYMSKLFLKSFINKNHKSYFKDDKNYWK